MVTARASLADQERPFSCSTNLANEVTEHLRRARLGSRALEFCLYLHRQTFGNAGWHRKLGRAEWTCPFDLAAWATALECARSNVLRIRNELVACHILTFEADLGHPGQGIIGWHLAFAKWQPYDGRRTRRQEQESLIICKREEVPMPLQPCLIISKDDAIQLSTVDKRTSKIIKLASADVSCQAARAVSVRNGLRNKETKTPDVVSEGRGPSPTALSGPGDQRGIPAGTAPADEPPRSSTKRNEDTLLKGQSPSETTKQENFWPPRQAWEQTDLSYYQRVLRECEKERVALLVRLAHERIGVRLETASYARMGALAKQVGAALVVKHILLAAANHIDGDPLDYLTKLARGQQRKEAPHATRPTAPTSGYQPYSAEEASHLVWNTL